MLRYVYKVNKKEELKLKRKVKEVTGRKIKDIKIITFSDSFIRYGYYQSKYDEVINNLTVDEIEI